MERFEPGMLAWSRAGHDEGQLYVILEVQDEYLYLTDGRLKPLEKPKKKKKKHVQVVRSIPAELRNMSKEAIKNEDIRRIIKEVCKCQKQM